MSLALPAAPLCHVMHVVYRFSTGGLENVIVQLVNQLPPNEFRHTIVALTEIDPVFAARLNRANVHLVSLRKPPGQTLRLYPAMYRLLRQLRPDVMHTCNLAAMELMPVAAAAGVPLRVHAEHGWDIREIGGRNRLYRLLRKLYRPFVHDVVAVSEPLRDFLRDAIGVPSRHLHLIPNGVDTAAFRPRVDADTWPEGFPFTQPGLFVIGMVGRLMAIKNPMLLVESFIALAHSGVPGSERLRLAIVGDGPLAGEIGARIRVAGLSDRVWLPGVRADIAAILRAFNCFVLPSLSEATSCTIQEAMATGLPIIATEVGGNPNLLEHGRLGTLVPSGDVQTLADAILQCSETKIGSSHGRLARQCVEERYSLSVVLARYRALFRRLESGHDDHGNSL